ncbi:MAG: type IV toxin-antitoxin system AbiEi family antitoxin [Aridibacter sp.]
MPRLQAQYSLIRDESGNIEMLDKFWTQEETDETAPPLVIYADPVATADGRNLETAQIIYERYLADIEKTAS